MIAVDTQICHGLCHRLEKSVRKICQFVFRETYHVDGGQVSEGISRHLLYVVHAEIQDSHFVQTCEVVLFDGFQLIAVKGDPFNGSVVSEKSFRYVFYHVVFRIEIHQIRHVVQHACRKLCYIVI